MSFAWLKWVRTNPAARQYRAGPGPAWIYARPEGGIIAKSAPFRLGREPAAPASIRAAQALAGAESRAVPLESDRTARWQAVGHNPKPVVLVAVVRVVVPVAVRGAHVVAIVVERPAAHHARGFSQPPRHPSVPNGMSPQVLHFFSSLPAAGPTPPAGSRHARIGPC